MQYEKTPDKSVENSDLKLIKISLCQTFHTLFGKLLYQTKFLHIEKFHEPGLAPAYDTTGAYHINLKGEAAYSKRFKKIHGFYYDRAAVEDSTICYHIDSHGNKIYKQSYQWVGNYQESVCVVRKSNKFHHIDLQGNKLYREEYNYVGDFKDDVAVVYKNGHATHINSEGKLVHNKWYKQLGIFHKGFAVAEDISGWFHIDKQGNTIYSQRYKTIEPFYNGLAKVESHDGTLEQIDITGNIEFTIFTSKPESQIDKISSKLAGFWQTYLTNIAIEIDLFNILPATTKLLSKELGITEINLRRLLRALWEIRLIDYQQNEDLWQSTSHGEILKNTPFLADAATM